MSNTITIVGLSAAALVVCATGVVLTVRHRPYGPVLLNVHKLIALGATIWVSVVAYQVGSTLPWTPVAAFAAGAAAVLLVVAFASGGVVSARTDPPEWVMWVHRGGSWLSVLAAVAIVEILLALG